MNPKDLDKLIELSKRPVSDREATQEFLSLWDKICNELVKSGQRENLLDAAVFLHRLCDGQVKP